MLHLKKYFSHQVVQKGDNWILKVVANMYKNKGRHIITSCIEHHAVLNSCHQLEKEGFDITYLPVNKYGEVQVDDLKKAIRLDTVLVSIMFGNNEIGTIQNIKELALLSHEAGALFHTDAVQAVGHVPIDVIELDVDFLTASAHKFNGYKGTGFAYMKSDIDIGEYISGGAQEKSMRAGTENVAGIVAMAKALKNNICCLEENEYKIQKLEKYFLVN